VSEKVGLKPTNRKWRKWASTALSNQRIRSGIDCGLTIDELIKLTPSHCPCCGTVLKPAGDMKNSPSVDRLDNTKSYEKDNIWIICHSCNTKKGNTHSPTDLYKIADAWWAKLKEIKCKLL
jgi:5-methylcytosine-specific restriction endonuclease McrA